MCFDSINGLVGKLDHQPHLSLLTSWQHSQSCPEFGRPEHLVYHLLKIKFVNQWYRNSSKGGSQPGQTHFEIHALRSVHATANQLFYDCSA